MRKRAAPGVLGWLHVVTMEHESTESNLATIIRTMSHDLRTPLTSIMGFSELLLEDDSITGEQRDYLQTISAESRKLSSMLNHYLSTLLVESGAE